MGRRAPTVGEAAQEVVGSLGGLASAATRWISLQPISRGMPEYGERLRRQREGVAGNAAAWAGQTGTRARDAGQRATAATRAAMVNLVIIALLLWWVDRLLNRP